MREKEKTCEKRENEKERERERVCVREQGWMREGCFGCSSTLLPPKKNRKKRKKKVNGREREREREISDKKYVGTNPCVRRLAMKFHSLPSFWLLLTFVY